MEDEGVLAARREFDLARRGAKDALEVLRTCPDFVLGGKQGVGSGALDTAFRRWQALWGLIYHGRERTALGKVLDNETVAECATNVGCLFGKSYVWGGQSDKLNTALKYLAKAARLWDAAAGSGDSFSPRAASRLARNAVRQLGFLVQAGRITEDDVERVLTPVRRVLPSTGIDNSDHAGHAAVVTESEAHAAVDADTTYAASVVGASVRGDVYTAGARVDCSSTAGTGGASRFKRRTSEPSVEHGRMPKMARLDDDDSAINNINNKNNNKSEIEDGDEIEDDAHAGYSSGRHHQKRACQCVRLPCAHSDVFRIDVGPFAQCAPLDDGLRRDLQRDTIPTLQLAGHFIAALRTGVATGSPSEARGSMLSAASGWPRLAARLPATVYDVAGCRESDRLTDALLVENHTERLRFMRQSVSTLRLMWALELESSDATAKPPSAMISSSAISRVHPVKRLLYRRPPADLLATAAAVGLGRRGAVLLYLSSDAAEGDDHDRVGGASVGCLMGRASTGGDSSPSVSAGLSLTLDDLTPFFRRPMFIIIDGSAGQGFCSTLRSPERMRFGQPGLVLTPRQTGADSEGPQAAGGTWLSYFLHAPAQALWALHGLITPVDLAGVDSVLSAIESAIGRAAESRPSQLASDVLHFVSDPFLRRLLERFVFFNWYALPWSSRVDGEKDSAADDDVTACIAALQDDGTAPALPTSVTANAGIRDAIARLLQNNASPHSMAGEAAAAQAGQRRRVETTAAQ